MLEESESHSFGTIVSWQPGGVSFKVNDPEKFETQILKKYFNQTKYKSFLRQLNSYNFRRVQTGPNKGGYIHQLFSKQSPELCALMERKRPSNKASVPKDNRETIEKIEPVVFSALEPLPSVVNSKALNLDDSDVNTFYDFFFPTKSDEKDCISTSFLDAFSNEDIPVAEFEHTLGQGNLLDIVMDDIDCRQILSMLQEEKEVFVGGANDVVVSNPAFDPNESPDDQNSFPWKLHLMLENSKNQKYQDIVSWVGEGSAFKVHNTKAFVEKIMPNYFDQTKYESFRRQLNLYGFTRISKGADKGIISHPYLREGQRWLCANIKK